MSRKAKFRFRLYIAGVTPNSAEALINLTTLCRAHLAERHEIEVVDVVRDPQRALTDDIRMTPTLLKVSPPPARRIVGTLSQTQRVLDTLGLSISV